MEPQSSLHKKWRYSSVDVSSMYVVGILNSSSGLFPIAVALGLLLPCLLGEGGGTGGPLRFKFRILKSPHAPLNCGVVMTALHQSMVWCWSWWMSVDECG